jgi:hypothetical protein
MGGTGGSNWAEGWVGRWRVERRVSSLEPVWILRSASPPLELRRQRDQVDAADLCARPVRAR